MKDLTKIPYASWLEKTVETVTELPVKSIGVVVMLESGEMASSFYNATPGDKSLLGTQLQQEAWMACQRRYTASDEGED